MPTYTCPRCNTKGVGATVRKPNGRHYCPECDKPLAVSQSDLEWS